MRIVRLAAENLKRLRAVEITPEGDVVVISGANGAGKTSILDAIWFALGGGAAMKETPQPIREGEDHASVTLDLGEYWVRRTWADGKTALTVTSKDGAKFPSPQRMLDDLVGRLSFDPLAFAAQSDRDQRQTLMGLVSLPFDPDLMAGQRASLYERRTEFGRVVRALEGQVSAFQPIPEDTPDEEVSAAEVVDAIRDAQRAIDTIRATRRAVYEAEQWLEQHEQRVSEMERALAAAKDLGVAKAEQIIQLKAAVDAVGEPPDLDEFRGQLESLEETNARVRDKATQDRVRFDLRAAQTEVDGLTDQIEALDDAKVAGLEAATFPIDGLGFTDEGVTYKGIPFGQCSAGERLRVSMAMAMALNPKLRVIRITDGSLLDSENMRLIGEMAAADDFQVWIERVDESGTVGIYIEDGAVVERD